MRPCSAMKPSISSKPAQVIAESIRAQLGTDAVVLIIPGSPRYGVVVAQAADTPARHVVADSEADREAADRLLHGEKLAYSVAEAARALGLSHSLIYDQLRTGRLDSIKVGRRRIITREHIDKFLAGR